MLLRFTHPDEEGTTGVLYVETAPHVEQLSIGAWTKIRWLLAQGGGASRVAFTPMHSRSRDVVEIGPRHAMETPWSTNIRRALELMGVGDIVRAEYARELLLFEGVGRADILSQHLDPMTEQPYDAAFMTFRMPVRPEPVRVFPILDIPELEAIQVLTEANATYALGLDAWSIQLYVEMFQKWGKDPTDVELFMLSNMNSEHCRHWFYKGKLLLDGESLPYTLLELVQRPLKQLASPKDINPFADNVGIYLGYVSCQLLPQHPWKPSPYVWRKLRLCITLTGETHNHPTACSPYHGAGTGCGGRIRDEAAGGQGSLCGAASTGYSTGNLCLPNHPIPGESVGGEDIPGRASAAQVMKDGSDGACDYGNCFGEPNIGGFTRTFGQQIGAQRYELRKPVLYSASTGSMFEMHVHKRAPEKGMLVVQFGGLAYLVGVGGGSASSKSHDESTMKVDLASVQRGDPEKGNKAYRVVRACVEMCEDNPLYAIHDQGAGGSANVLTELVESAGARLDVRQGAVGDAGLSVLHQWVSESQERYGVLTAPDRLEELRAICKREGLGSQEDGSDACEVWGEITGDGRIVLVDSESEKGLPEDATVEQRLAAEPVCMPLADVLTDLGQREYALERVPQAFNPLVLPDGLKVRDALQRVFLLPQVGSKGFLVHKGDRSVGGRVAQQQCCGPMQIPICDFSVTADSYRDVVGAATAIGEQPIKMLLNAAAGARMSVGEMLTNFMGVCIENLGDVRCRVNVMWPASMPGERVRLHDAVNAASNIMCELGIAANGGKDSLSMTTQYQGEVFVSPGSMVLYGAAPVPDVRMKATPDMKRPGASRLGFIDLGQGKDRLGGSSLAQVFDQVGDDPPDVDDADLLRRAFNAMQGMVWHKRVLAVHDRSDGGLLTTVVEMCLARNCGATLTLPEGVDPIARLFSEELGVVFEYLPECEEDIRRFCKSSEVPFQVIGKTLNTDAFEVWHNDEAIFASTVGELRCWWEATSSRLDEEQASLVTVAAERSLFADSQLPVEALTFTPQPMPASVLDAKNRPRVAILRAEGTNGDREMAASFDRAGFEAWDVCMNDLDAGTISLDVFQGVAFCGGFSFMDVCGSGKGWAGAIRFHDRLCTMFQQFRDRADTFSLGVCNGCQLVGHLGWMHPNTLPEEDWVRFERNTSGRFESRWTRVRVNASASILFQGMEGSVIGVAVAHAEGRASARDPRVLRALQEAGCVPISYANAEGASTTQYPFNPNGSPLGIAGICTPDGRHTIMMPHPERSAVQLWQSPYLPSGWEYLEAPPWLRLFQNARAWCVEQRPTR